MKNFTSDKEGIHILTEILVKKGVKYAVLSPGSRNAPLLVAFARECRIRHFVVLDERSAAFFALGIAQQTGEPVVLVCTSGTAPLNYAPAIAEAYYQRLPLIVITADRPEEWIDQNDSQTIRQYEVFRNFVKSSYQLPAELHGADKSWYANRIVNDALICAGRGRRGPVHINIPLCEPLYGLREYPEENIRTIEFLESASTLPMGTWEVLKTRFQSFSKVMILVGFHLPDDRLKQALYRLAGWKQIAVLSETPSNLNSERHIGTIDRVLATLQEEEKTEYAPDLLITFGGPLISRHVKAFLRRYAPREHWSIDRTGHPIDTFKGLTTQINLEAEMFFPELVEQMEEKASGYAMLWQEKKVLAKERHKDFAGSVPWSDWKAFSILLPEMPEGIALQLANSTPVRYAQLFDCPRVERVDSNRGTSGIDGSTSTAVGASVVYAGVTLLITGDMSFLYDSNALWNAYVSSRFKMIVMKNGGGGIFRFIDGPSQLEELEECFETNYRVNVEGFAKLHHFRYFHAGEEKGLQQVLPAFWAEKEYPAILCIETPGLVNAEILKAYFKRLKQGNGETILE